MRFKCFLLLAGLGLLLGPAAALTPLRGQPAAGGRRPAHLKQRWGQLAGDAAVWRRADVTDPLRQFVFDLVAQRVQSTNGEITREQFLAMAPAPAARKAPAAAESPKAAERKSPTLLTSAPAKEGGGSVAGAEAEFRRRDANHDGRLDYDEMDQGLRAERDRWDANGDGFIDLAEFKAYFRARTKMERAANRPKGTAAGFQKSAITKGNSTADLPPGLPPWFREYDRDGDGQIGLYEWRAAGQPLARFLELDFNGDGFLTPDEVLPPDEAVGGEPEADPGALTRYQGQIGKLFKFRVTGAINGGVWGSGVYTTDSTLATAAVHAGVLKVGQTGTVKVRIVAPPESFSGSTANGVTTNPFGTFPGAYRIVR